jgi:hypothetical protein
MTPLRTNEAHGIGASHDGQTPAVLEERSRSEMNFAWPNWFSTDNLWRPKSF